MTTGRNLLSDRAVREITKMRGDVTRLQNQLRLGNHGGPRKQQQRYARLGEFDATALAYPGTEVIFDGSIATDWVELDGGITWGGDATDAGYLYAIDSTNADFDGVHPLFQWSDGSDTFWGFIAPSEDETVSFKHFVDETDKLRFYEGHIHFNNNVDETVAEPAGGFEANDGWYYVEWQMTAGDQTHATQPEIQYSASEPDFWNDAQDGTITVKWPLGHWESTRFITEWENDIDAPGSGLPLYTDMTASADPTEGRYAGIKDATTISDRVDHEYFAEIVDSSDKFAQGSLYSHTEGDTYKFGGLAYEDNAEHLTSIDDATEDEVSFIFDTHDSTHRYGLLVDASTNPDSSKFTLRALGKRIGIEPGGVIYHKQPEGYQWISLGWDGTNRTVNGTPYTSVDETYGELGHLSRVVFDGTVVDPPPPETNYRYRHCSDTATFDDIVISGSSSPSLALDSECYYLVGETFDSPTTPAPTIDGTFANCTTCEQTGSNELWNNCDNDASIAVLDSLHTDVDLAFLCIDSTYFRGYNAGSTFATATNPTVLKQCGTTPAVCGDLVGWPSSDNFGGTGCNSGSVGDTDWTIRWTAISSGSGASQAIVSSALRQTAGTPIGMVGISLNAIDQAGQFTVDGALNITQFGTPSTGTTFAGPLIRYSVGGSVGFIARYMDDLGAHVIRYLYPGGSTANVSLAATSLSLRVTRDGSNSLKMQYNTGSGWTTVGTPITNSGNLDDVSYRTQTLSATDQDTIANWTDVAITDGVDGGGSDIYIDPTGDAC